MALRNPAQDVVAHLNGRTLGGLTLTSGANLFPGPMRDFSRTSNPAVFVLNAGGPPPVPYLGGSRQASLEALVVVMVRGAAGDFPAAEALARALWEELQLRTKPGYIDWRVRESQPVVLEPEDDSQRPVLQLTVACRYSGGP